MATTQIHSNVDLNGHLTIAQNVQEFPADPQMGQIIQKGGVLYTYGDTGSGVISWLPMSIRRTTYVHQQFLPSAEWIVNHNLNTTDYGLLIYDADHNVVVAPNEPIDSNSVRVTLTTPISGTAILIAVTNFSATSLTSASLTLGSSVVTVVDGKLLVDGVAVSDSARIDEHIAALDPHSQYLLKSGGILTGALSFAAGQEWPTFNQSTTGNAGTATKLETARLINGVSFNGTADITINAVDSTAREPAIITGTTTQYWRGDKSWQTLDKAAVGLGNVDNTSDLDKPVSTATQQALDDKEASGTAATAMSAHTSAADPHGQYLPKAGGTMSGSINFDPAQTWPTFNQSTTGNAGTATKLETARTLTIGSAGKTFDGTANVAWTLAEIGAQAALVSGTNIKTVNSQSILGTGNIVAGLSNFTESLSTASPNNTTSAIALTANGTATNIDFCMVAKGTGALLAPVPNGAVTGGNKRGLNATDFQQIRGAASQVASGVYSVISGGGSNTASGSNSAVGGGYDNIASGLYSVISGGYTNIASGIASTIPGGYYATANGIKGLLAYGFSGTASGQNQMSFWGGRLDTTNATPTRITADAGAASATNQLTLRNNSAFRVRGTVVARSTSTNDCKEWTFEALIKRGATAADTTIVGTPTVTSTFADTAAAGRGIAVTADTTNGALAITATGVMSTSIRWTAVVHSIEVA